MVKLVTKSTLKGLPNWDEWVERWNQAEGEALCLSLLHIGFDVYISPARPPQDQIVERLVFFLDLADSHQDKKEKRDPLASLSEKAFEVLAYHHFRQKDERQYQEPYELRSLPPTALEKMLWFFRPYGNLASRDERRGLHNLVRPLSKPTRSQEYASAYCWQLMRVLWRGEFSNEDFERRRQFHEETSTFARKLKPQVLEIVNAVRRHRPLLSFLDDRFGFEKPEWKRFDKACLAKLKEMALDGHDSIEAAVVAGSTAAFLYVLCGNAQKEVKRQEEIAEAKRMAAEANSRLAKLQS